MTPQSVKRFRDYMFLVFGLFVCMKLVYRHGGEVLHYLEQSVGMMIH